MKVLITGGAGYIGSHMALALLDQDNEVVILDNLTTGSKKIVPPKATFIEGDVSDLNLVQRIFDLHDFEVVAHFAGSLKVEESVKNPFQYYENNSLIKHTISHYIAVIQMNDNENYIIESSIENMIPDTIPLQDSDTESLSSLESMEHDIIDADIAILLSKREGLPLSLLEAAATGLPIISTDVTGSREIAINNYNAINIKPGDIIECSKAILKLSRNKIHTLLHFNKHLLPSD